MRLKSNTFFYQATVLAASNLALQLLGFAYRILLSRLAGPEGMGVYTLVMQVYTIVISVCLSGFCVAVTTLCARASALGDAPRMRRLVNSALLCFLLLFLLSAAPVAILHNEIATQALGDARTADALWMVLACIFLTGFENILKAAFHGVRLVRHTACSEVGEHLLRIAAVILLLVRFGNGDHGYTAFLILSGMTISELYSVLFLGISYWRRFLHGQARRGSACTPVMRPLLQIALPSAGTAILCNIFSSIAVIVFPMRLVAAGFSRSTALRVLGVLSGMAGPLMMLPLAFVSAVCTLLMPSISVALSTGDRTALRRKVDKGIQVTGLIALPCTALLLPFVPILCALLFRQSIGIQLTLLLGVQTVVGYYLMATSSMLNGMGKQRQVLCYAAIGELLQLGMVWWLTGLPAWNVAGYITGMICGDLLRVVLGMRLLYHISGVRPNVFSNYIVPAATAVMLWALSRYAFLMWTGMELSSMHSILLSLACCAIAYWFLLRLLGVRVYRYLKRVAFVKRV